MALPVFKDPNTNLMLMQTNWTSQLNPIIANPLTDPAILKNLTLVSGNNIINHKLGRVPQGFFVTDINAASVIYRAAPYNNLTLTLNASAACTINLAIF